MTRSDSGRCSRCWAPERELWVDAHGTARCARCWRQLARLAAAKALRPRSIFGLTAPTRGA